MSACAQISAMLQPHPDTPCPVVESIRTALSWTPSGVLTVDYSLSGAVDQLLIPAHRLTHESDNLWRHTCFELFVGAQNDAEYYEFNFSPSGQWAVYGFRDYRDGGPFTSSVEPEIVVHRDARTLKLTAAVRLDCLPGIQSDLRLWVGLSAVVEDLNDSLSYWALKHPPGKPDFHHSDNFALQVEPTVVDGATID
jgi:hypothetical protein